jgi:predicted ester cyclase
VPRGPLRRASGRNRTVDHAEIARAVARSIRHDARMSENLRILGAYSAAMERGDRDAVFEHWSPDFVSHVTERVSPDAVGTDVRGQELEWWTQVRNAFPDMTFTVDLLIESGDLIVSNWTVRGTHTGTAFYDVEPSGNSVIINGTGILRMRDGKVAEHWGGPHCQLGLGLIR